MSFHWCLFCLIPKTCPECGEETQRWFNGLSGFFCYSMICCFIGPCTALWCCQQMHCQKCFAESFRKQSKEIRRSKLFIDLPSDFEMEGLVTEVGEDEEGDAEEEEEEVNENPA